MIKYSQLVEQYVALVTRDANACVNLGASVRLGELPDPSVLSIHASELEARELLAGASGADIDELSAEQQLDLQLIALTAKREIQRCTLTINDHLELCQRPVAGDEISSGIFMLFINDPRPAAERLDNIYSRIEQIPLYLTRMLERLETPVKRWVDIDIETVTGLDELFATIVSWAKEVDYTELPALEQAIAVGLDSLEHYVHQLKTLPTTEDFAVGADVASEIVANNGIEMSLDEIHQVAVEFFSRTKNDIEQLRRKLCEKYQLDADLSVAELQAWLNKEYGVQVIDGDLESVIERYKEEHQKLLAFNQARQLFPVFDEQDIKIMQTPGFMAPMIPAGAMMSPAPLREGIRRSMVYLTLSEELLDEHTELGIPVMMIHEGLPGHHLQLATAATHESVVRRIFPAMDHAEGWTTMLEDYMLDQGYMGELSDEARFIAKLDISRIGARVAIDLYFMTGEVKYLSVGFDIETRDGDVFGNAGRLLKAVSGFTDARIQGELNWYSQERGYPMSYLVGNHLVWQLKADFNQAQAGKLDEHARDQRFHQIFLNSGCMPVAMLRQVFSQQGWL